MGLGVVPVEKRDGQGLLWGLGRPAEAGGLGGLPVAQVWDRLLQGDCLWGPTGSQMRSPKIGKEWVQQCAQISTGP